MLYYFNAEYNVTYVAQIFDNKIPKRFSTKKIVFKIRKLYSYKSKFNFTFNDKQCILLIAIIIFLASRNLCMRVIIIVKFEVICLQSYLGRKIWKVCRSFKNNLDSELSPKTKESSDDSDRRILALTISLREYYMQHRKSGACSCCADRQRPTSYISHAENT